VNAVALARSRDFKRDLIREKPLTTEEKIVGRYRPGGGFRVKLASKGAARRTILEQTGQLKGPLEGGVDALVRAIRGDLGEDEDA